MTPRDAIQAMNDFADTHLAELCQELVEWQDTALLRDGRMRELARLCTFDSTDSIRHAERATERAAIRRLAAPQVEAKRQTGDGE